MNGTIAMGGQARRKRPVGRALLIAFACILVIEPLVMYRSLERERGQREAARAEAARQSTEAVNGAAQGAARQGTDTVDGAAGDTGR